MLRSVWPAAFASVALGAGTPAGKRAAARSDAMALLSRLQLPPGATASAVEPSGDGGRLARPAVGPPATPNAVDRHGWWRVPGDPAALIASVAAHPAAGSHLSLRGHRVAGFDWPARRALHALADRPGRRAGRRIDRRTRGRGGRVDHAPPALRADPSGAAPAARHGLAVDDGRARVGCRDVTPAHPTWRAAAERAAAAQPGPRSCASEGVVVRLAFHARRGRPADALAAIDPAACLDISLTLHGRPQPPLATTRPLIRRLARALGLRPGFFTRTRAG